MFYDSYQLWPLTKCDHKLQAAHGDQIPAAIHRFRWASPWLYGTAIASSDAAALGQAIATGNRCDRNASHSDTSHQSINMYQHIRAA